jgi:hypothetical protein
MSCNTIQHDDIATVKSLMKCDNIYSTIVQKVPCSAGVGFLRTWLDEWGAESIQRNMTAIHYALENNGPYSSAILSLILKKIGSSMLGYPGEAHTVTTINASRRAIARNCQLGRCDRLDPNIPLTYTPLAWAAILDNDRGVKDLIDAGADVNSRTSGDGHTALTAQSILSPRPGIELKSLSLLLNGGASRDIYSQGSWALENAVTLLNWSLAKLLMEAEAPVNVPFVAPWADGITPLQFCLGMEDNLDVEVIKSMMLEHALLDE